LRASIHRCLPNTQERHCGFLKTRSTFSPDVEFINCFIVVRGGQGEQSSHPLQPRIAPLGSPSAIRLSIDNTFNWNKNGGTKIKDGVCLFLAGRKIVAEVISLGAGVRNLIPNMDRLALPQACLNPVGCVASPNGRPGAGLVDGLKIWRPLGTDTEREVDE